MNRQLSVILKGVRVITPGKELLEGANTWIEEGKIQKIDSTPIPADAVNIIDATGLTLVPGLIDSHLHILGIASYDFTPWLMEDVSLHAARAVGDMAKLVDAGFTTVRDAGSDVSLGMKGAQSEGCIRGPRVWASGRWISCTGNLPDIPSVPMCVTHNKGMGIVADGVDECRRAVRGQVRSGADMIKIATTGGIQESFLVAEYTWSDEELSAIVDTAHGLGRRVSVHNNVLPGQEPTGMRRALRAGVDTIDHGYYIPDDVLNEMAERGTFFIATISYLKLIREGGKEYGLHPIYIEKATIAYEAALDTVARARAAGVRVACGSDLLGTPFDPHGINGMELEIMRDAGFTDQEVLEMVSAGNAAALGIDAWTGQIACGYSADLLLVDGHPDQDIAILTDPQRIKYVMVAGVEQKNTIEYPRPS